MYKRQQLTNYTTIGTTRLVKPSVIKHIQLVSMGEHSILLIIVTDTGDIKKSDIPTKKYLDQAKLNIISDNLTRKLGGKSITDIDNNLIAFIKYEIGEYSSIVDKLLSVLNSNVSDDDFSITLNGCLLYTSISINQRFFRTIR